MEYKKLNKVLNKYIKENNSVLSDPDAGSGFEGGSYPIFKVEDPEVLAHINTFLKNFGISRHHDPKQSLVLLRTKLNTIGLDFSYDGRRPLSPNETFHLTQFGGRTGVDEKGNILNDDGISHRNGGKGLELSIQISPLNVGTEAKEPGPYYIQAKIVSSQNTENAPIESGEARDSITIKKVNEEQDECYYKVKAAHKVFPSAYASGNLVQCRKVGAENWGNKEKD